MRIHWICLVAMLVVSVALLTGSLHAQLSPTFYAKSCPNVSIVVRNALKDALTRDFRAGAKLVRLHYHDCFVNGCDCSVLLDNAEGIVSEKDAYPNAVTLVGYNIADEIKTALENACPGVVSCADMLALSAEAAISQAGGPSWDVPCGRRDSLKANRSGADSNLPQPFYSLNNIKTQFFDLGFNTEDLVALSGIHTLGYARCKTIKERLYNFNDTGKADPTLNTTYLEFLRQKCPPYGKGIIFGLDPITPTQFDNIYYKNLQKNMGLFHSDQMMYSESDLDMVSIVNQFASNQSDFFDRFVRSMIKMSVISPLTGADGEVRLNCGRVNG